MGGIELMPFRKEVSNQISFVFWGTGLNLFLCSFQKPVNKNKEKQAKAAAKAEKAQAAQAAPAAQE